MEAKYMEYLEEGTKKMIEIVSSLGVGEDEKRVIVETFANELSNNIGNTGKLRDYEQLLYVASIRFIDEKITSVLINPNASYRDYENAIRLCQRQRNYYVSLKDRNWELPKLKNADFDECEEILRKRQESISISSKIIEEDRQIDDYIRSANADLSVKACDTAIVLATELEEDIALCKQKNVSVPFINNTDTQSVIRRMTELRVIAEQKEALHQRITDDDLKIHSIVSLQGSTSEQWLELVGLCRKQIDQLADCTKNGWPCPLIKYNNPKKVAEKYRHYLSMVFIDRELSKERNFLTSPKQYKSFFENCEKQKKNIEICVGNEWDLPSLAFNDLNGLLTIINTEKSRKDRSRHIKCNFIKAGIVGGCILALVIFCVYKYREGKIQIPFDYSYVSGVQLSDVYSELEEAGFENITQRPNSSGWLESGQVMGVSIDNSELYSKGSYEKPDVSVVITYSCEERKYVTDLLVDWNKTEYTEVQKTLKNAGYTNIMAVEVATPDRAKDKLTAALSLNKENYTNEDCYLPVNAPIVISYYVFKIGIGFNNSQFIGQDYESVVNNLKESGFTNIQTQMITTGIAKGNSVVGVTVNNTDTYKSSESFDPDVKIVVKYSSNDRVDITSALENWETADYNVLQSDLKTKGCNNITLVLKETNDIAKNGLVASITLNNDSYGAGDCCVQATTPIKIEYYVLTIVIGESASDFEGSQYTDVVKNLKTKGFTNIQLLRANNLITGWLTKEGSINSFTINGNSDFADTDSFYYDAGIVIVVNTFEDEGCEDITGVED